MLKFSIFLFSICSYSCSCAGDLDSTYSLLGIELNSSKREVKSKIDLNKFERSISFSIRCGTVSKRRNKAKFLRYKSDTLGIQLTFVQKEIITHLPIWYNAKLTSITCSKGIINSDTIGTTQLHTFLHKHNIVEIPKSVSNVKILSIDRFKYYFDEKEILFKIALN